MVWKMKASLLDSRALRGGLRTASVVGAVAVIALGGMLLKIHQEADSPVSGTVAGTRSPTAATESFLEDFPAVGVTLSAPSQDASPPVSPDAALRAVSKDGLGGSAEPSSITLAIADKKLPSADGSSNKLNMSRQLVWHVIFRDAPSEVRRPVGQASDSAAPPCDLHVLVNADTGEVLEGFQVDCATSY